MTPRKWVVLQGVGINVLIVMSWMLACLLTKPPVWGLGIETAALVANTLTFIIRIGRIERNER